MIDVNIISNDDSKQIEKYDRARLRANVMTACLSVRTPEGQAERTADSVCDDIEKWLISKQEVTTKDIVSKSAKCLEKYHADAAYLYEQKHIII